MKEHDTVVLKRPIREHGLLEGDVGAIVHVYPDDASYEVEFVAADGSTIALLTLGDNDIRPRNIHEILHVRQLTS
jgi:hypothetical protein